MALYGVYESHTTEAYPSNNQQNRKSVINGRPKFKEIAENSNGQVKGQFHSGLEHTFLWVLDAKDAQSKALMIEAGISKFNALTIVPPATFEEVIKRCKEIENPS